jgi:hypothetical protein
LTGDFEDKIEQLIEKAEFILVKARNSESHSDSLPLIYDQFHEIKTLFDK